MNLSEKINLIKQYSLSRDGLMTIKFISNVRNQAEDIRNKQHNEIIDEHRETYDVSNSFPNFDVNEEASLDDILESLTVAILKNLLQTFNAPLRNGMRKAELIQLLKQTIQRNNQYIQYVKDAHTNYVREIRASRQRSLRDISNTVLISNFHKYKRSDFDGMSFKDIIRSLFDIDDHLIFIANKVLKGEKIPDTTDISRSRALAKIKSITGLTPELILEKQEKYLDLESIKNDRILTTNSQLVLSLLFEAKRPFYINKKKYTILSYHQENEPPQPHETNIEMNTSGIYANYSVYKAEIYLDLSELPPNQITARDIQKSMCHHKKQTLEKNWKEIWGERIFERSHRQTIKRPFTYSGGKRSKRRKTRKKNQNWFF